MSKLRIFLGLMVVAASMTAYGQSFPSKPIRIIVPAPPGASADVLANVLKQQLAQSWGQPLITENRVGDNANIGAEVAARSPGDGYTWILLPDSTMARSPHLGKLPFDVFKDFTPVTQLATVPFALVVHPSLPVNNVNELIAYAKANPGKISYGSSGNGSVQHMLTELLKYSAGGIDMLHVPYKGSSQTITDLIAGRLQVMIGSSGQLAPFVKDSRLKLLASAGARPLPEFPGVPTLSAQLPAFGTRLGDPWIGLFMPANVPRPVITQVNAEVVRVLNAREMKADLASKGFDVATSTPEGLASIVREDHSSWGKIIRAAGVKAD